MKNILTLGTLLLGLCLAAVAQAGSAPNQQTPPATPSMFQQDQTGQTQANPATSAQPSALPPDQNAQEPPAQDQAANPPTQAANSQKTTVQGCLSQSADGNFMLADNSGNSFQLTGDAKQLSSFVGNEIQVDGMATLGSDSNPGAMSSAPDNSAAPVTQISVSKVKKISKVCSAASGSAK